MIQKTFESAVILFIILVPWFSSPKKEWMIKGIIHLYKDSYFLVEVKM
jgi:hypothetical protein